MNSVNKAIWVGAFLWIGVSSHLIPSAGAAEAVPAPTIWDTIGLTQGWQKIRDATVNRLGNHPGLEAKPSLKAIADAANLESGVPVLEKAAEVKIQEDAAPQKVKAIKYLAEVGCGCHPQARPALLDALYDCTEEVRYEAAVAFCEASGSACSPCGGTCCSPDVMAKLQDMATGKDENGCHKEPSARVRAAAKAALEACRRKLPDVMPGPPPERPPKELPVGKEVPVAPVSATKTDEGWVYTDGSSPTADRAAAEGSSQEGTLSKLYGGLFTPPALMPFDEGALTAVSGPLASMASRLANATSGGVAPFLSEEGVPGDNPYRLTSLLQPETEAVQPPTVDRPLWETAMLEFPTAGAAPRDPYQAPPATTDSVTGQDPDVAYSPEPVEALLKSPAVPTTKAQRRASVAFDPNIRGFKAGQIYSLADGAYWTPARQDLDTMLSKIDSGMIQDMVVIPGPYGLRYGPGFAFIDVVRAPTPRYADGFQAHFRTVGNLRTNGGQVYGRETISGGSCDWGFRFSYGHRRGSDYEAGNGLGIPSSYQNRDIWGEFSYDVNPYQHVDVSYQRLDQTDTEYPGQIFDVGYLQTYGFNLRVVDEDPAGPWSRLSLGGWYNRTRFSGNTFRKENNLAFPVVPRIDWALDQFFHWESAQGSLPFNYPAPSDPANLIASLSGTTEGYVSSSGFRTDVTFGEPDDRLLRLGADFRYLSQFIAEHFGVGMDPNAGLPSHPNPDLADFTRVMPRSWLRDAGVYAEWSAPLRQRWRVSIGARADWVATRARAADLALTQNNGQPGSTLPGGPLYLSQDDILYAFYLINEFDLGRNWTLRASLGHGQRPPTLLERYANGNFIGVAQSGFTRLIGDPRVDPARNWQIDFALATDRPYWRGGARFFNAWVVDYITYEGTTVNPPPFGDARLLQYVNTDLATLVGFEAGGEIDLLPRLSGFANISYVEGQDRVIDAPLPAIPPLEGVVGFRLHDPEGGRRWGIELAARIVDNQNRLGAARSFGQPVVLETPTPGFTVFHLRGYWNRTENLSLVAGVDNLFDKAYQEHLDLRLFGPGAVQGVGASPAYPGPATRVLSPGFTPYVGVDWVF
ncbi:MAG: TonB-dependent receptor [Planctomycetota bacterium]|jgi:outer membrane receptor protein involved in Fe transport